MDTLQEQLLLPKVSYCHEFLFEIIVSVEAIVTFSSSVDILLNQTFFFQNTKYFYYSFILSKLSKVCL